MWYVLKTALSVPPCSAAELLPNSSTTLYLNPAAELLLPHGLTTALSAPPDPAADFSHPMVQQQHYPYPLVQQQNYSHPTAKQQHYTWSSSRATPTHWPIAASSRWNQVPPHHDISIKDMVLINNAFGCVKVTIVKPVLSLLEVKDKFWRCMETVQWL